MGKIRRLLEGKEIVTLIVDGAKFSFFGDDGTSKSMSEKDAKSILDSIEIISKDTKSNDSSDIIKAAKSSRDKQVDLEVDSKYTKKLGLK